MQSIDRRGNPALWVARVAAFVALGVVGGLALMGFPNVEVVTATCFISGALLGTLAGMTTGALVELLFAGFHPMGSSMGFLLLAQMMGMIFAGLFGSVASVMTKGRSRLTTAALVVLFGAASTVIFDLITNLAYPLSAGMPARELMIYLAAGVPFAVVHLISNVIVFSVLVVPLIPRLRKVLSLP